MKNLLLLAAVATALTGCGPSAPLLSPTQEKVTAYLKKTLDDPASYQSVRWSKQKPFQQKEVDVATARDESAEFEQQIALAKIETESMARLNEIDGVDRATFNKPKKAVAMYVHRAYSVKKIVDRLEASTDTTRLGESIQHTFRAKNKMGALVLDSVRFIVRKTGEVVVTGPN